MLLGQQLSAAETKNKELSALENLGPSASGFGADENFGPADEQLVDPNVLRDFIESKGLIECRKKSGLLTIAGDVRARWSIAGEEVDGIKKRGWGTKTALNRYKSEVNLFLDYVAERSWVSTKLQWAVYDGKDGGSAVKSEIDRAFIGYDIYHKDKTDFYIELGRSKLSYIFDSRVEFNSTFDGIHLYYSNNIPSVGELIVHGGPLIVDSFSNHYAWVVEAGVVNIAKSGLGAKYSIIDWRRDAPTLDYGGLSKAGTNLVRKNPRYAFLVSQMLFGYQRDISFLGCKVLYIYGAVLANHDAKCTATTHWKKLNGAWYAGFTLGKLCKACDWSLDVNYQSVQAQAVPEFDLSGIGHGNADNSFLSDAIVLGLSPAAARGFNNYKGWSFSGLYAMTDTLSLRAEGKYSVPRNKSIGGDFRYKCFEMSVIYAF